MSLSKKAILVIGEVLIDIFPDYQRIGGAPFNFSFHLSSLGFPAALISKVGDDHIAAQILSFMNTHDLLTSFIQKDPVRPTGRVEISLDKKGIPEFTIVEDCAYDFIEFSPDLNSLLKSVSMIYIGTLSQRNSVSRNTIQTILSAKKDETLIFYDINIRMHYYSKTTIDKSLHHTNILKLNDDEIIILKTLFNRTDNEKNFIRWLMEQYSIEWLCLTRGEKGSTLFHKKNIFHSSPLTDPIKTADTVGAGDAYSAILAAGILANWNPQRIIDRATAFSASVCELQGAVPTDKTFYKKFLSWGH